jgi:hypothetical protein
MINRETILRISAYLDLKRLSANKFGFQNLIKIEGISTGSAHPIYEGETGQLKRCTCIREAYFKPPQTPLYYFNLWKAKASHGFLF